MVHNHPMNALTTRLATSQDLDAVAALFDAYRQFYEQAPDLALATTFMRERIGRGESAVIVAENEHGEMVGFCQLYPTFCSLIAKPIYILSDLYVAPASRRSGAGRALLLAAEPLARQRGFARLDLTTAKTNLPAQALYESLGWMRDNVFLAYSKDLPP